MDTEIPTSEPPIESLVDNPPDVNNTSPNMPQHRRKPPIIHSKKDVDVNGSSNVPIMAEEKDTSDQDTNTDEANKDVRDPAAVAAEDRAANVISKTLNTAMNGIDEELLINPQTILMTKKDSTNIEPITYAALAKQDTNINNVVDDEEDEEDKDIIINNEEAEAVTADPVYANGTGMVDQDDDPIDEKMDPNQNLDTKDDSIAGSLRRELEACQQQLRAVQQQRDNESSEYELKFQEYESKLSSTNQTLEAQHKRFEAERQELLRNEKAKYNKLATQMSMNNADYAKKLKQAQSKLKTQEKVVNDLKQKHNEVKTEINRMKQTADKAKKDKDGDREMSIKRLEKAQAEIKILNDKLTKQKALLEAERKEKSGIADKNQDFLRNEKQKIAKQLHREKDTIRNLETQLIALRDKFNETQSTAQDNANKLKMSTERQRKLDAAKEKALQERDDIMQTLQNKSKEWKLQQSLMTEKLNELELLVSQSENQKNEIRMLHESIRKKAEKEKEFDAMRKKLNQRQKKLEEKERNLNNKIRRNNASNTRFFSSNSSSSSSQSTRKLKESIQSKDPLHAYRNLLPFHWICIFLIVILMMAIAQKN